MNKTARNGPRPAREATAFGRWLLRFYTEKGWSQSKLCVELAKKLGQEHIDNSTVSKVINGLRPTVPDWLINAAHLLSGLAKDELEAMARRPEPFDSPSAAVKEDNEPGNLPIPARLNVACGHYVLAAPVLMATLEDGGHRDAGFRVASSTADRVRPNWGTMAESRAETLKTDGEVEFLTAADVVRMLGDPASGVDVGLVPNLVLEDSEDDPTLVVLGTIVSSALSCDLVLNQAKYREITKGDKTLALFVERPAEEDADQQGQRQKRRATKNCRGPAGRVCVDTDRLGIWLRRMAEVSGPKGGVFVGLELTSPALLTERTLGKAIEDLPLEPSEKVRIKAKITRTMPTQDYGSKTLAQLEADSRRSPSESLLGVLTWQPQASWLAKRNDDPASSIVSVSLSADRSNCPRHLEYQVVASRDRFESKSDEERLSFLLGIQHLLRRTESAVKKIESNRARSEDQLDLGFMEALGSLADYFEMSWDDLTSELWHIRFAVKPSLEFSQMLCEAML